MNSVLNALLPSLILLGTSYSAAAYSDVPDDIPSNDCYWISPPGIKDYRRDIGTLYVPKDAAVGTFIGSIDMHHTTPDKAGLEAACRNDGTALLEFNATATDRKSVV